MTTFGPSNTGNGGASAPPIPSFNITDRRLNPGGKNLNNRQRFLERVKEGIKKSVAKGLNKRNVGDQGSEEVSVSRDGIDEPNFQYDRDTGIWDHLLPGNEDYISGDHIRRPPGGGGAGRGNEGSPDGEGQDDFRFGLTYEEYIQALLGDLELPDMVKESQRNVVSFEWKRAGFTPVGPVPNLAIEQTVIRGIGRRIALRAGKYARIAELTLLLEEEQDEDERKKIETEIEELRARAAAVPFLDTTDLRFHNTTKHPNPITQAVMFALMDVSGSMTEHMKDLAKRFYILLFLFLKMQYKEVKVVFIRHTHVATEVDEETFFHSPETGGTVVSTAYAEMEKIVKDGGISGPFPIDQWNIYCAQVSDGDNSSTDNRICEEKLGFILPWLQYFTYVEVGRDSEHFPPGFIKRDSDLMEMMKKIMAVNKDKMAIRQINHKGEIIEVFRSLFKKKES